MLRKGTQYTASRLSARKVFLLNAFWTRKKKHDTVIVSMEYSLSFFGKYIIIPELSIVHRYFWNLIGVFIVLIYNIVQYFTAMSCIFLELSFTQTDRQTDSHTDKRTA